MKRRPTTFLALPLIACGLSGCGGRPAGVPEDAVRVMLGQSGGWVHCWLDHSIHANRCRTYNAGGERLYRFGHERDDDDVFLPDDGSGPVAESDLKIDTSRPGADFVWLQNGIVLLPRNDFANQKKWIDEIRAAAQRKPPAS